MCEMVLGGVVVINPHADVVGNVFLAAPARCYVDGYIPMRNETYFYLYNLSA